MSPQATNHERSGYAEFERPSVTVDIVVLAAIDEVLNVLLIRRGHPPFSGSWAIPGGFVEMDESLEAAAARELAEETGVTGVDLEQLHTFGDPGRDPRGRTITVVYLALLPDGAVTVRAGDDAAEARWYSMTDLPPLAFDHKEILELAQSRLHSR